jgi:putative intracellular protease/amidase
MITRKILIVVTNHDRMGADHQTGIWLSEFAEPYEALVNAGHQVTVASIKGGKAPIDPNSSNPEAEAVWQNAIVQLQQTVPLKELTAGDFDAIFLPGGHGTMFDLPNDSTLQTTIRKFVEMNRIVATVCHGSAGLVSVTLSNGEPFVKGKKLTSFTNDEERAVQCDSIMPFLLEDRLRELGATFISAPQWSDHVISDGNLITGQNPQSSASIAKVLLQKLEG